ncbi:MAG: hypothetical protein PHE89_00855 [Alphaproteobacteria bacterium]|nr:hypothetical protein [Alphaproteobacteria bacterium]
MRLYLIAVSKQGDRIGANLIEALKKKSRKIDFCGIGGPQMGLDKVIPYEKLHDTMYSTKNHQDFFTDNTNIIKDIIKHDPDIVITIANWDFASEIHQKIKKIRKSEKAMIQIHYVAPRVFSHNEKIAKTVSKYVDFMISVFPQEIQCFSKHKLPAVYVGHPVLEVLSSLDREREFRHFHNIASDAKVLTAMLGSDEEDVKRMLPFFISAAKALKERDSRLCCTILAPANVYGYISSVIKKEGSQIKVFDEERDMDNVLNITDAGVAAHEGATLLMSVAEVPHIVVFKESFLSRLYLKKKRNFHFLNLSNEILDRDIIPIYLNENFTFAKVREAMYELLKKEGLYNLQKKGFADIKMILSKGSKRASENAGDAILDFYRNRICVDGVNCIYI